MRTGAIFFCAVLFLVAGCAEVPRPATFPYSFQQQLQSASHWEDVAKSTVEYLCPRLTAVAGQPRPEIYVQSSDKSPFGRVFRTYLITELIKSGFSVSSSPDRSVTLNWEVYLIRRNVDRLKTRLPGLPEGVIAVAGTLLTGSGWTTSDRMVPHTELILTATLTKSQQILAASSKTYYINDPDRNKYWESDVEINPPVTFTAASM